MPAFGADKRGQGVIQGEANRYKQQQGPMVKAFARNYGRGSEADYGNYTDIMNRYRTAADSGANRVGGHHAGASDPFKSYTGYEEFSKTGGYSPDDIANMRSRGISPIRAAYSNAEREVGRQRSLQGGYSPNAVATLAKMAREQSQGTADATQNVEAGLAQARNQGRLSGLSGMSNIEGQRLNAELEASMFNAGQDSQADQFNVLNQNRALEGMTNLYGTTPGMSQTFGNQLLQGVGQGGQFGLGVMGAEQANAQLPGMWDEGVKRVGQVSSAVAPWAESITNWWNKRNKKPGQLTVPAGSQTPGFPGQNLPPGTGMQLPQ